MIASSPPTGVAPKLPPTRPKRKRSNTGIKLSSLGAVRLAAGMSRAELARTTGLNYCSLWRLENGTIGALPATVEDICSALSCSAQALQK